MLFFNECIRKRLERGGNFLHEQQAYSDPWKTPEVQELAADPFVFSGATSHALGDEAAGRARHGSHLYGNKLDDQFANLGREARWCALNFKGKTRHRHIHLVVSKRDAAVAVSPAKLVAGVLRAL